MLFYRGATEMEGIVQLEFEALKKYLEESSEETKLSLSDFRKFQLIERPHNF